MRPTRSVVLEILRVQLWVVPSIGAGLAAVAAIVIVWLDRASGSLGLPLDIGADSARMVLSAVSGAMISFTALVFSVTMLVLQLASTQLSPRVTRTFLRDRFNQSVLGLFVATFVFALLVLAGVEDGDVPQLGLIAALALVLAAVLAFVAYIDHMAHAIRPTSVIGSITAETRAVIDRIYTDEEGAGRDTVPASMRTRHGGTVITWSGPSGYLQSIDEGALLAYAVEQGHDVILLAGTGRFLVGGTAWLRVPDAEERMLPASDAGLEGSLRVGAERTMGEDPEFGFRQLVDVALRALSPGVNDPSTAGQSIDRLHELLRQLQRCAIPAPKVLEGEGGVKVVIPAPDWDAYVRLAVEEIGQAGHAMPRINRLLRAMLEDLHAHAGPHQRSVLEECIAGLGTEEGPACLG